jgi:hypothetical protein
MPTDRSVDALAAVLEIMADETLIPDERLRLIEALFVHDAIGDECARPRGDLASETIRVQKRRSTRSSHAGRPEWGRADRNAL